MTAAEILQILTGVGVLIGIIVNAVISLRNGWKVDVVAAHVNSAATKSQEENRALQSQVIALKADMAEKKEIAALLAAKVMPASAATPTPVEIVNAPTDPVPVVSSKIIKP